MSSRYHEVYAAWQRDPEAFWAEAAREIDWYAPWQKVFDPYDGQYGRWFVGAECNTAWNCLDRHVAKGRGQQKALIYDSPVTKTTRAYTYAELRDEVATLGAVLQDLGVGKGDRVILYMPMVPEAVIAMLACARIGAVHSVVFGGFAAPELATRIDDAKPVAILSASCGIEPNRIVAYKPLLDAAIELSSHKPKSVLMLQRPMAEASMIAGRDYDWASAIADAKARGRKAGCVAVKATDPLYILYTSGTTGAPKGVVRDNGGHMVALKWTMKNHYGIEPGETFWAASDVGWVVGHSYICYAPLLHGCTSILYEGKPVGTPDAGAFWRVIAEHKVSAMFTAPTAFRAIKKEDPKGEQIGRYDLRAFRTLFLAGERADPETIKWAETNLSVPVYDHWWQTETGWPICGNPVGLGVLPVKYGSPTVPMPGYDLQVLDAGGNPVKQGETGTLAIKLPLPPSCLPTLWNNDARFRASYLIRVPRLLHHLGRRLHRRRRLRLRDGPHRRRHQRRRPSPVDRADGGGGGQAQGRRRMRGGRRCRRDEGPDPGRVHRAQRRRQPADRRDRRRGRQAGARRDRPGGGLQDGDDGQAPAQDALGQDPARHHALDRRRRGLEDAGHHR